MLEELKNYLNNTDREKVLEHAENIKNKYESVCSPTAYEVLNGWDDYFDPIELTKSNFEKMALNNSEPFFFIKLTTWNHNQLNLN